MSTACTPEDCNTCSAGCGTAGSGETDFRAYLSEGSKVKHVYAVMSGKGGVGKSLVTALLAAAFQKKDYSTAILDADITGPSIPRIFGVDKERIESTPDGLMIPGISMNGTKIMSANMLLQNETDPIIWRGSLIASCVKQFYSETFWGDVNYMFVDMPPGTGDVPLTVFQSLPVDGIIIVTSPQELVSMIVAKAVNMAKKMDLPIVGVVENMAYYQCPECGHRQYIFGKSHVEDTANSYGLKLLAEIPIDPRIAEMADAGKIEYLDAAYMDKLCDTMIAIDKMFEK